MIELSNICKTFKVAKRDAGFKAATKALFKKDYTYVEALKDISFTIEDGEMVGYIGPNGAGKSSTIKIMSGVLNPDSGTCIINGRQPHRDRIAHVGDIGVVFGQRSQLWWDVPVIDSFELLRDIYRVNFELYTKMLNQLTDLLSLGELLKTPTRQLSLGQRMRCEIAASLLHCPKILFLDEPTIGLDAVSKIAVRDFIKQLNKQQGTTVILTTHDMQDIEALTERILLIGKGEILLDGTLSELKKRSGQQKRILTVEHLPSESDGDLSAIPGFLSVSGTGGKLEIAIDTDILPVSEAISTLCAQLSVTDISIGSLSAEEIVVSLYKQFEI